MSNEDKNFESDFEDFPDGDLSDISLLGEEAGFNDDAIEKAMQNINSQMTDASTEIKNLQQEAVDSLSAAEDETAKNEEAEKTADEKEEASDNTAANESAEESKEDGAKIADEVNETISQEVTQKDNEDPEQTAKPDEENKANTSSAEAQEDDKTDNSPKQNISKWEELDDDNNVVKKYIVYISKDFVPIVDNLSIDQRSAYINDAIQMKVDAQDVEKQNMEKRNAAIHFIIAIVVVILFTPIALIIANKAIMATFDNYKYSQENFEKLYQQRFEKDKAFMRALEHNREVEKRMKKQGSNSN